MHKVNVTVDASAPAFLVLVSGFAAFPISPNGFCYMHQEAHLSSVCTFCGKLCLLSSGHQLTVFPLMSWAAGLPSAPQVQRGQAPLMQSQAEE